MTDPERDAEAAASALAPEAPLFTDNDPALFGKALAAAARPPTKHPLDRCVADDAARRETGQHGDGRR